MVDRSGLVERWVDDNFSRGWSEFATLASYSGRAADGSVLDVYHNFTAGQRGFYILQRELPSINTSDSPYVLVRWKSDAPVARVVIYDTTGRAYQIVGGNTLSGYGGALARDWDVALIRFLPDLTLSHVDLGVDSGSPSAFSGTKHAYFDYIILADFDAPALSLNNFRVEIPFPSSTNGVTSIRVDSQMISVSNSIEAFFTGPISFRINSLALDLTWSIGDVQPPFWQNLAPFSSPLAMAGTVLEILLVYVASIRLRRMSNAASTSLH
jgi:hypothetical protein